MIRARNRSGHSTSFYFLIEMPMSRSAVGISSTITCADPVRIAAADQARCPGDGRANVGRLLLCPG
jgi:hypothetical protein